MPEMLETPDYMVIARTMKTSDLIACLTHVESVRLTVDPDGALNAQVVDIDNPDFKKAEEELARRCYTLIAAAAAEIDRRIPIPGETGR
jgi:hypothetical protein